MPVLKEKTYFMGYVFQNSTSFYFSTVATCLLVHACLTTTTIINRRFCLILSAALVFGAVSSMIEAFTDAVSLALDPQNNWREWFLFYFIHAVKHVINLTFILPVSDHPHRLRHPATPSGSRRLFPKNAPQRCPAGAREKSVAPRLPPDPEGLSVLREGPPGVLMRPPQRPSAIARLPAGRDAAPPPALSSSGMARRSQIRAEPKGGASNSVSSAGASSSGSSAGVSSSGCSSSAWREGRAHGAGVRTRPGLRCWEGDPAPPRRGHHTHLYRHECVTSLGEIRPPACSIRSRPVPSSTRPPVLE
jgi:hypothetical protein